MGDDATNGITKSIQRHDESRNAGSNTGMLWSNLQICGDRGSMDEVSFVNMQSASQLHRGDRTGRQTSLE